MESAESARTKLRSVMAAANEFKEGDLQVGGTLDEVVRAQARSELAEWRLGEIGAVDLVSDAVTEAIKANLNPALAKDVSVISVDDLRRILVSHECPKWVHKYRNGLRSECIAAVVKLMSSEELSKSSRMLYNPLYSGVHGESLMVGSEGHLGSRIQPNSPSDDPEEILLSILEGLSYGCGDVIIGLNPSSDTLEEVIRSEQVLESVVQRLKLPTRYCVLSDMAKQSKARMKTRVDVGFQSLGGTSKSLVGMLGVDVAGYVSLAKNFSGLYFETGQGAEVTNRSAEGVDMVTLEARCYGLAKYIRDINNTPWMIVNDVAGFIGPEVFRTSSQLLRACLEDTLMAKLHGITMGLDVCSTFHMGIHPFVLEELTEEIVEQAAPAYLMAVAGKSDPMLGYLTTSFREHPRLRKKAKKRICSAMEQRLCELGVMDKDGDIAVENSRVARLYALYKSAGGDKRRMAAMEEEALLKLEKMKVKGFDLGYGCNKDLTDPKHCRDRVATIFDNATTALHSSIDPGILRSCSPSHISLSTVARTRDSYLSTPELGEQLCDRDAELIQKKFSKKQAHEIQFIISDGLNANAVNINLRELVHSLKQQLKTEGFDVAPEDFVVKNGRVRAGYHLGACADAECIVHLIGERPGTGLDQLSAYITYGRDQAGESIWDISMDHSLTTVICGINPKGKTAAEAKAEIVACIQKVTKHKVSGVALTDID